MDTRFIAALSIWIQKPQVVHKDVFASSIVSECGESCNWSEKTDPLKFVYEDIGIACYLICLWKNERVNFVDLGCGNGLLTYILLSEGFKGIGIDVRKRRIWESYPPNVQQCLKELSLNPENDSGFSDANWLIGNHSDELTPWLPVLACKSGPSCKLFVLPCCPYGLFGKFNIPTNSLPFLPEGVNVNQITESSRYGTYLNYIQQILAICGFIPEVDALRIPSTKRMCIIGRYIINLEYLDNDVYAERLSTVQKYINFERNLIVKPEKKFIPRSPIEKSSNCSNVSRLILNNICEIIFTALLNCPPCKEYLQSFNLIISDELKIKTLDNRWWNPGGVLSLSQCSKLISLDDMKLLKSQNGGLQTVLRNHHQCFRTIKNNVQLRWLPNNMRRLTDSSPALANQKSGKNRKTKPCWMLHNHPDGCPYPSEFCDFAHSENEIISNHYLK
ncbi:unnamed protein product [Heterobilharzia americana]|nr:unnamed protein product [Heterobilharzia americana]